MNAHSDEFDMADDFRDLSQAYRDAAKREDDQEPSPALDAIILAAAHRAVASRPQAVRRSLSLARWRLPLAMAASFLVGVFIVMAFVQEKAGPKPQILAQAPQREAWPQPSQDLPPPSPATPPALAAESPPSQAIADEMAARESFASAKAKALTMPEPARSRAAAMETKNKGENADKSENAAPATQRLSEKQQNPQTWLEEIEKLRRDGKIKEARKALTEFRKRYPDHAVPKTLRDL